MEEYVKENATGAIEGVTTTGKVNYGAGVAENANNMEANIAYDSAATINTSVAANATVASNLPTELGFWSKLKSFFLQEIRVELTPRQKKIEKELNDFLFQEISFGKKKK